MTGTSNSSWHALGADEFEKMNLQSMEDLWDQGINMLPNMNVIQKVGVYSTDKVYISSWFQPYNDKENQIPSC